MSDQRPRIGVLALQGDFDAHRRMLSTVGAESALVRTVEDLDRVDGLIIPGGESTTIAKLMDRAHLAEPIRARAASGMPVYGTCAGLILMATDILGSTQPRLGLIDIEVARNAFGRQIASFEADIPLPCIGSEPVRGVFIRAPYVTRVGAGVETLGEFEDKIVAVRAGRLLGTAFHPELTSDTRVHSLFARIVSESEP